MLTLRRTRRISTTLRGGSYSSLLVGVPTTPSKAALAQSKCQSQEVDPSTVLDWMI
jgi:hypothetical protein